LFEGETVGYLVYSCMVPAATTTTEIIAPGAERILHVGSWWQVFIAELAPTPGRMGSTLRATIAMLVGIVLMALVGNSAFIMCPVTSMTESTPGTLHSPGLLLRRILTSVACGAYSIMLVAAFAQAPMLLFLGILAGIWLLLYLIKLLPVGSSGLRVAIWTLAPLLYAPLTDPTHFEVIGILSVLGVSSGVIISYLAALFVFPGAESVRMRYAIDGLLAEQSANMRIIAQATRAGPGDEHALEKLADTISPSVLAHIAVLSDSIATYATTDSAFPELVPLTRVASLSDSATVHLNALAREGFQSDRARAAASELALEMADFFDGVRAMSYKRHWARWGDRAPEVAALVARAEAMIAFGDNLIEQLGDSADDFTLSIAGYARRGGGMFRGVLTQAPLPAKFGSSALALPLGFPPNSPLGKAPTIEAALTHFNKDAALGSSAAVLGLALALVLSALFLPGGVGPSAIGAVFVLQSTVGGSGRRGVLRFFGTLIGGVMAAIAIIIFAAGVQDLGSYILVMGVMAFMSAWVLVGSPRTNYMGLMMAAAWIIVIASDPGPSDSVGPMFDRVTSVVVAGLSVTFTIWMFSTKLARVATMQSIANGWRQIGQLLMRAQMLPFTDADLTDFRMRNHLATANLASTCDLREQYTFEARIVIGNFAPVLEMLAQQQRVLLLARSLATGRFHDSPLNDSVSEMLNKPLRVLVERIETLGDFFITPPVVIVENGRSDLNKAGVMDGASIVNSGKVADDENYVGGASVQTVWKSCGVPSAAQVRESAIAQGFNTTDVARLIYRRDALALLENSVRHAQDTSRRGFVWSDNSLHSALELADGKRTYAEIFNTMKPLPQ
jgi:uncharacterized membrane protein YgaE (UPF0421/DUF939 family)